MKNSYNRTFRTFRTLIVKYLTTRVLRGFESARKCTKCKHKFKRNMKVQPKCGQSAVKKPRNPLLFPNSAENADNAAYYV